jgi:hypothetical protein
MKTFPLITLLLLCASVTFAADTSTPADSANIEHGRYLCEQVCLCGECHTPRTDKGDLDRSQWLQGELVHTKPDNRIPYAAIAPPIAGLPGYATDAIALRFFETGTNSLGKMAMAPMPQFRFNHDDALAVVAYLRSFKK